MSGTLSLFQDVAVDVTPTEGVKYAGSKLKLIPAHPSFGRES